MQRIHRGFTIIELMITVAIAAIVLAVAIPSFQAQIRNNQSIALGEDFASAINFARSEAVKRATRVSLCASDNGISCGGAWTDGFIAFVDVTEQPKIPRPENRLRRRRIYYCGKRKKHIYSQELVHSKQR